LFTTFGFVASLSFLRLGGNFNGKLDRLLESVTSTLVNGLDGLDINVGNHKVVVVESQL